MSKCKSTTVRALCKLAKHPDDDRTYYCDFAKELTSTDTLDGVTAEVAELTSFADLTIGSAAVLASDTVVDGKTLYANKALTCRVSGGSVDSDSDVQGQPREYELTWTASTTNGDTINIICVLVVTKG
jgi:hypothetical protein